jgi:hypothetical protein
VLTLEAAHGSEGIRAEIVINGASHEGHRRALRMRQLLAKLCSLAVLMERVFKRRGDDTVFRMSHALQAVLLIVVVNRVYSVIRVLITYSQHAKAIMKLHERGHYGLVTEEPAPCNNFVQFLMGLDTVRIEGR